MREYSEKPNNVNEEGIVEFDVIKEFPSISVSTKFLQQKYFELNLNTINKSVKSAEAGFFEISVSENCPPFEEIDFNHIRNIYIVHQNLLLLFLFYILTYFFSISIPTKKLCAADPFVISTESSVSLV